MVADGTNTTRCFIIVNGGIKWMYPKTALVSCQVPIRGLFQIKFLKMGSDDIETYFRKLASDVPSFRVPGDRITVLHSPKQFFTILKECTNAARRRISLATLYLGTGTLERELVSCIENRLVSPDGAGLSVRLLFDHSRGTRGPQSSVDVLRCLLAYRERVQVSLFHSPSLRGWLKRCLPERWNEIVGLQHMKIYVFDDDVIISGANLSDSYFTNRQDRYIHIAQCPEFADFCAQLLEAVHTCSLKVALDSKGEVLIGTAPMCDVHPYLGDKQKFSEMLRNRVEGVLDKFRRLCNECVHHPGTSGTAASAELDTSIYPFVQYGCVGLKYEHRFLQTAFADLSDTKKSSQFDRVLLASGYFNIRDEYTDFLSRTTCPVDVVVASPLANGFFGASGFAGYIPAMYSWAAQRFLTLVRDRKALGGNVRLLEYFRDGWTFHSKGMWWRAAGAHDFSSTLFGSSNYGYRSEQRDLEAQFLLVTSNSRLQKSLTEEKINLVSLCKPMNLKHTFSQPQHYIPMWVRLVSRVIRHFF